jgi:hypothetical protein
MAMQAVMGLTVAQVSSILQEHVVLNMMADSEPRVLQEVRVTGAQLSMAAPRTQAAAAAGSAAHKLALAAPPQQLLLQG